jgi:hypothetical protein
VPLHRPVHRVLRLRRQAATLVDLHHSVAVHPCLPRQQVLTSLPLGGRRPMLPITIKVLPDRTHIARGFSTPGDNRLSLIPILRARLLFAVPAVVRQRISKLPSSSMHAEAERHGAVFLTCRLRPTYTTAAQSYGVVHCKLAQRVLHLPRRYSPLSKRRSTNAKTGEKAMWLGASTPCGGNTDMDRLHPDTPLFSRT